MIAASHSATILIVDDTPANLRVIIESLEDHGYAIAVATRGEEALKRAEYVRPDLILLDVMLPDLDGFEICRRLKAQSGLRDTPVIFMTSLVDVEDKLTGFDAGGVDYVTKPLQVEEVRARVSVHLRLRSMQKQLEEQNAQLQQRTAQLTAANEELEAFAYCVSHDLRAPLRAIAGFTQILAERHNGALPRESVEYLNKVLAAARHMDVLINELLTYARTGRGAVRAAPVPLAPLVEQLESTFSARIAPAGARFKATYPLATPVGDPTLIEQILTNLVDNALKYRRPDVIPEVKLSSIAVGEHVLLQVMDNGIGIPAEHQERIFQVFQRLHTEREYPGVGIGLAIVAKAVRAMGGDVSVRSSVGQGSTFSIRLPAATAVEQSTACTGR